MCGRFTHLYSWRQIYRHLSDFIRSLSPAEPPDGPAPSYNTPPTALIPVIRSDDTDPVAGLMQWWLVPAWSRSPEAKYPMFNARSETAATKPAFRAPFKNRRCIIPASGFYEWQRLDDGAKQPHYITRADGTPLYFAGLWDRWEGNDETLETCTILTTEANAQMSAIHDRMPCILEPEQIAAWLDTKGTEVDAAQAMLKPAADGVLEMHPVSRRVGNVRNDDAGLIEPELGCDSTPTPK